MGKFNSIPISEERSISSSMLSLSPTDVEELVANEFSLLVDFRFLPDSTSRGDVFDGDVLADRAFAILSMHDSIDVRACF